MTGRNSEVDLALCNVPMPHPFTEAGFDDDYQYQNVEKPANDLESGSIRKRMSSYAASSFAQRDNTPRLDTASTEPEIQLANDSHLYFHYLQLFLMSRDVTKNLYTIDCSRKQWPDIEASISTLWDSTVLWLRQLPDEYNFGRPDVSLGSAAMSLGCFFYSVRIMITRPCLCRYDRRRMASSKVASFHQNTAEACVKSAKANIELFPDEFNVHRLCEASTWWQFTHYLVQAITILLIELRFWEKPGTHASYELVRLVKKALHSIWLLSRADASALRAWSLCNTLFRQIALDQDLCIADLTPSDSPSNSSGCRMRSSFDAQDITPAGSFYTPFDEVPVFDTIQ